MVKTFCDKCNKEIDINTESYYNFSGNMVHSKTAYAAARKSKTRLN